jgi:two-component system, sensor histidine kinase and response regulator
MVSLRILLVDSNEHSADKIAGRLTSAGHSTVSVPGVDEAMEALLVEKFDAIVLGVGQPDESLTNFVLTLRQRNAGELPQDGTAIFSCSPDQPAGSSLVSYLPPDFTAAQFAEATARFNESSPSAGAPSDLAVFIPGGFEEQCASDPELMLEIIDLFSEERERELAEMRKVAAEHDFERLARIAHTMKGSLGTLNAPRARFRSQELESAAKDRNFSCCARVLDLLDRDLASLQDELATFRLRLGR